MVTFQSFGLTGLIQPYTDNRGNSDPADDIVVPGLIVTTDGLQIGRAELRYKPGQATTNSVPVATPAAPLPGSQPLPQSTTPTMPAGPAAGTTIKFGTILEFDDLRVGVINFNSRLREPVGVQRRGLRRLGRRQVPAGPPSVGEHRRPPDCRARRPARPAQHRGRAGRAGVRRGRDQGVQVQRGHDADRVRIRGDDHRRRLRARHRCAAQTRSSSRSSPSAPRSGSGRWSSAASARNFAFEGDGDFKTRPGFGVFLTVGGATGDSFKWPSWLPIKIESIGIEWRDIEAAPSDFLLTLSASVTGIQGIPGLEFSGTIEGVKIDVGKLLDGEFPVVQIDALGVSVRGNVFGGELNATLLGGILRVSESGAIIDPFDIRTPVADRVLFVGVEGGFSIAGIGGITIRFGVSELGPLTVMLEASVPGGILLEPNTGLAINDFVAGVEFFKTLPSIDDPLQLRGPAFNLPAAMTVDEWLTTIQQQVARQWRLLRDNPALNGFTAAFTAPMTITGSAKLFTIYASEQVFNGQVIIKISTDGKFMIAGRLNFAADNISVSAKLYADLSKVASGEVTVLFLADVPDQVRVLTLYGRLKTGFRNATGEEVTFVVPADAPLIPTPSLAGPAQRRHRRSRADQLARLRRRQVHDHGGPAALERVDRRPRRRVRRRGYRRRHGAPRPEPGTGPDQPDRDGVRLPLLDDHDRRRDRRSRSPRSRTPGS